MSKKATAKEKAQRQQHRKNHFTDADRQIQKDFKGDQKGRQAARMQGMSQQGNKGASDFNFDQYGKGHVSRAEVKTLRKQGQSRADIMSAAKSSGAELGKRTQKQFARWDAKAAAKKDIKSSGGMPEGDPNQMAGFGGNKDFDEMAQGTPYEPGDSQKFLEDKKQPIQDSFNTNQEQSFDRNFGNNENTIGDGNNFYGNFNQGNQDFSINIGNQQAGAGGTAGGGTMSNAAEGAAAKGGFENTWERSNAKFNPMAFAAGNVAAADQLMGTSDLIKGLDQTTDANIDYYRKASDRSSLGLYGDTWNMKAPTWKSPGQLDKIETSYDKDDEEE